MSRIIDIRANVVAALTQEGPEEFVIEGKKFTVRNSCTGVHVWAKNGSRSLFSDESRSSEVAEFIGIISERIDEYCDGFIHCSDCGKMFAVEEIEGYKRSYFAGVYCQECWDRKWKALEAQETYD